MLHIGASRTDITPPVGIRQAGFSSRTRPLEWAHIHLFTRAFVFSDGDRCAALPGEAVRHQESRSRE